MRARFRLLDVPRLSQCNWNNDASNAWCGRTCGSMIYNYLVTAHGGAKSDYIKNEYDKEPYNLIYPDGSLAATVPGGSASTSEPLTRFFKDKYGHSGDPFAYQRLWTYAERAGGPPSEERMEQELAPILDHIDRNMPVLFASGVTFARTKYASHFIIISGYRYDESNALWFQITDPAMNHGLVKDLYPTRTEDVLHVIEAGRWVSTKGGTKPAEMPRGSLYEIKASILFTPNKHMAGKGTDEDASWGELQYAGGPAWGRPPGVPLLCDNDQSPGGFAVLLSNRKDKGLWEIPDNELVKTDRSVAWPVSLKKENEGNWIGCLDRNSPFPIGRNRTWHSGVLVAGASGAIADQKVHALARGTVEYVRFPPEPVPAGAPPPSSAGMVLLKHEFDPSTRLVLEPRGLDPQGSPVEEKGEVKAARDRAIPFYSFYLHLAPLSVLLDEHGAGQGNLTPPWLAALAPKPIPGKRNFVPADTLTTFSTWSDVDRSSLVALPLSQPHKTPELAYVDGSKPTVAGGETQEISVDGTQLTLPTEGKAQRGPFSQLVGLTLPRAQGMQYYNPLTDQLLSIPGAAYNIPAGITLKTREPGKASSLLTTLGFAKPAELELDVLKEEGSDCYVAVDHFPQPGVQYKEGATKGMAVDRDAVSFADGVSVPVKVADPQGEVRDAMTLSGPTNKMRFSAIGLPKPGEPVLEIKPRLIACVELTSTEHSTATRNLRTTPATVPSDRKLKLFNSVTEEILTTELDVAAGSPLATDGSKLAVAVQSGQSRFVVVPGYVPSLAVSGLNEGQMRVSTADVLVFEQSISQIDLYLETRWKTASDDKTRWFPDGYKVSIANSKFALAFSVREAAFTNGRDRIWVDLQAVAKVPKADVERMNKELKSRKDLSALLERLDKGYSRLHALELQDRWRLLDDGRVGPIDPLPPELHLTQVTVQSGRLSLVAVKGGTAPNPFQLAATADLAVMPVHVVRKGEVPTIAYLEVFESVPKDVITDNQSEIDAITDANAAADALMDELRSGALKDVRDRHLRVGREWIGKMGATASDLESRVGAHVEVFSGENLVDPNVQGEDDTLVDVPRTTWKVLRDDQASGQFTPGFIKGVYDQLVDNDPLQLDADAIPYESVYHPVGGTCDDVEWVPSPSEWLDFCATGQNPLNLSRVITAHALYWSEATKDVLDDPEARAKHLSQDVKDAIAAEIDRLGFWTGDVALQAKGGGALDKTKPVFHFQPLRFVEWLNTGLQIDVDPDVGATSSDAGSSEPVTVEIKLPRGSFVAIPEDAAHPASFHYRTVVGDVAESVMATLKLVGLDTSVPELPVEIRRGAIRQLRVGRPHVEAIANLSSRPANVPVPVRVTKDYPSFDLLADGGELLLDSGLGSVAVDLVATYNQLPPTRIVVTLSESQSFRFAGCENVEGYSRSVGATRIEYTASAAARPEPFNGVKTTTFPVYVRATTAIDKETKVMLEASGGDLAGTRHAESNPIKTRTIKPAMTGDDVAKLMLLLSQIPAEDGRPCYRLGLNNKGAGTISADGQYGRGLANAIWRFAYFYVKDSRTAWSASSIAFTSYNGKTSGSASKDDLRAGTGHDPRVGPTCSEYPIVDAALVAEIVKRFDTRYVLPTVQVSVGSVDLSKSPAPAYKVSFDSKKLNASVTGRASLVPRSGDRVEASLDVRGLVDDEIALELALGPNSQYKLAIGSSTASEKTVTIRRASPKLDFGLVYSGASSPTTETLTISTSDGGVVLLEVSLPGARDVSQKQDIPGRDIALLQLYLSQIRDSSSANDEPCYRRRAQSKGPVIIDGVFFEKELPPAIERYKQVTGASGSYAQVASAIYDSYIAAQTPPAATGP